MNEPLLIPDCVENARRDFADSGGDVRAAESVEAVLGAGGCVGIARVQRYAERVHDKVGDKVSLKEHVDVGPGSERASVVEVSQRGVGLISPASNDSVLDLLKRDGIEHVVQAGLVSNVLIAHRHRSEER